MSTAQLDPLLGTPTAPQTVIKGSPVQLHSGSHSRDESASKLLQVVGKIHLFAVV